MPHDLNGNIIQPGDEVTIKFKVKNVYGDETNQFCNCDLESVIPMPGNGSLLQISAVNTQQTEKVEPPKPV